MGQDNHNRRNRNPQPIDSGYDQLQPHAAEVEKAVLGAQMIDKDAYSLISDAVKPETYYDSRHQMIQEAITTLSAEEKPVDVLTVTEQLARLGYLQEIGGPGYIAELSSKVASSANIEYHAKIIVQKALARQLISFADALPLSRPHLCRTPPRRPQLPSPGSARQARLLDRRSRSSPSARPSSSRRTSTSNCSNSTHPCRGSCGSRHRSPLA